MVTVLEVLLVEHMEQVRVVQDFIMGTQLVVR
jgi:hypothetical protein